MTDEARRPRASAAQRGGPRAGRGRRRPGRPFLRPVPSAGGGAGAAPRWRHRPERGGPRARDGPARGRCRCPPRPPATAVTAAGLSGASTPAPGRSPGDVPGAGGGMGGVGGPVKEAAGWGRRRVCPPQHGRAANPPGSRHRGRASGGLRSGGDGGERRREAGGLAGAGGARCTSPPRGRAGGQGGAAGGRGPGRGEPVIGTPTYTCWVSCTLNRQMQIRWEQ